MTRDELDRLVEDMKRQAHIVTSTVAYAIAAIERDPTPVFQLGTPLRMGLSDEEALDPAAIAIMQHEYRAWVVGHGLADISEAVASLLNSLVLAEPVAMGYSGAYSKFERLGLELKVRELPGLNLDSDYVEAIKSITRARNCLIHRHGVVDQKDCLEGASHLEICWRGVNFYVDEADGPQEIPANHRGGFTRRFILKVEATTRQFGIGSRLVLPPSDLSSLAWCIGGIIESIKAAASRLLTDTP